LLTSIGGREQVLKPPGVTATQVVPPQSASVAQSPAPAPAPVPVEPVADDVAPVLVAVVRPPEVDVLLVVASAPPAPLVPLLPQPIQSVAPRAPIKQIKICFIVIAILGADSGHAGSR
jgi:hypothetical protein